MDTSDIAKLILNVLELSAALTGIYYIRKWKHTIWQFFPYLLMVIFLAEMAGKYTYYYTSLRAYNYIAYRYISIPASILFYFTTVHHSFKSRKIQHLVTASAMLYIISWFVEEFFLNGDFVKNNTLSKCVGLSGLLIFIIAWLTRMTGSKAILAFKKNMHFWVFTGLLAYYIITLPYSVIRYSLYKNHPDVTMLIWYVSMCFNYLMYSFFIIGFKWAEPKLSYSL
jgi:hypothetical protein